MTLPKEIAELVERFDQNKESYLQGAYNEAQVRQEFIAPFFKALGWDVDNAGGLAEAYKDVIHEDAIRIGSATKAPDYCFRIGGTRKFFLEAKRPSINVKEDHEPAYQLRRYAWSAKLPLSILTDFEEFAVYDCRIRPRQTDSASTARVIYCRYMEYVQRWEEIASIFSKEAILKGSFDKYAQSEKRKRGTAEVDAAFLAEIESWRDKLAHNIATHNPHLNNRQLNFAVQVTIDRIIFLRICEDRGIERYGELAGASNGSEIYQRLMALFRKADDRYNSGLFHFSHEKDRTEGPDELTPDLKVDDKPLKELIHSLYYPESPYEFSVLPAEILGQVYEQFLGKVISLTPGHHARVEDKPEVKKAGGVFYTPSYVVDYIVKQSVGELLEGRSVVFSKTKPPRLDRPLRVLDPACGSGSFLLGVYHLLLNWYREHYSENEPEKWAAVRVPPIYRANGGWKLTLAERKRILVDHIFGVDIDTQAVEVTKLSLLLRVLEGEKNLVLFHNERALPDLAGNIKCGNSLVGPDFYNGHQLTMFDEDERYRINAFDWRVEFSDIFNQGGFHAVIGNPPYGAELTPDDLAYLRTAFNALSKTYDTYELFLLKGEQLLSSDGLLSMIVPASWLTGEKYLVSRRVLTSKMTPLVGYAMPFDVFRDAYIDTAVVVLSKAETTRSCLVHYFSKKWKLVSIPEGIGTPVPVTAIRTDENNRLTPLLGNRSQSILKKLKNCPRTFGDWFQIRRGVQPYSRKKHSDRQIEERFLHSSKPRGRAYMPELQGNELSRYFIEPHRASYLKFCDEIASTRPLEMFQGSRIVLRRLLTRKFRIQASMTDETMITTDNVLTLVPRCEEADVTFSLGLLNSRLLAWLYVGGSAIAQKDDFPQVFISALASLPIPKPAKIQQDQLGRLVKTMLQLQRSLATAKTPNEKTSLQRQIGAIDERIDRLVYDLYGLTEEEIEIVEEALR
jgi:hypothetical protein